MERTTPRAQWEVLALDVGPSEDGAFWLQLPGDLVAVGWAWAVADYRRPPAALNEAHAENVLQLRGQALQCLEQRLVTACYARARLCAMLLLDIGAGRVRATHRGAGRGGP